MILVGIDRPAKRKITYYGPDKHIIDSESILALRFIKTRNGEPRTSFFKAEYEKMRIIEMSTPPCYQKRI